jgi:hypothetical protein
MEHWSHRILEYWSRGVVEYWEKQETFLEKFRNAICRYSITPSLQYCNSPILHYSNNPCFLRSLFFIEGFNAIDDIDLLIISQLRKDGKGKDLLSGLL